MRKESPQQCSPRRSRMQTDYSPVFSRSFPDPQPSCHPTPSLQHRAKTTTKNTSVTQWDEGARGTTQVQKQKSLLSSPALTQQYGPLSQTDSGGAPMFCPETSTSRFLSVGHTHRHSHQHHFYYSTKPEKCQSPFVIFSAISRKTGAAAVLPLPPFSTNTVTTYFGFSTGKNPVIHAWQYSVPSGAY